jgi:hypothetical protein
MGLFAVIAALAACAAVSVALAVDRGGTAHGDRLVGTKGDDVLKGLAGDDKLFGREGRDVLIGGPGPDSLHGEGGRDSFNMRDGVVLPAPGRDRIYARDGHPDSINCGAGRDLAVVDVVEDGVYDCETVVEP